jgi:hypothetical protein
MVGYRQKKEALKRLIDSNPNQYSIISAEQEWKLRKLPIS